MMTYIYNLLSGFWRLPQLLQLYLLLPSFFCLEQYALVRMTV